MSELVGAAIGSVATAASSVGWFVPMLVAAIAYFQYEEFMDPEARVIDVPTDAMLDKYDFIIIGAGSAGRLRRIALSGWPRSWYHLTLSFSGAVLANRLTEVENWNVLLLEAGGDETEISEVPLMAGYLQLSKLDWKYKTEPSGKFCLGKLQGDLAT